MANPLVKGLSEMSGVACPPRISLPDGRAFQPPSPKPLNELLSSALGRRDEFDLARATLGVDP